MVASGVVVFLLVLVPSLLFLVAGIVLLVYGLRRQRRDREALQAYVGRRLQEGEQPGTQPQGAGQPAATPPSQDNTGLVWAIIGGVLTFFGVAGLGFVLLVGTVVALRSQTG